MKDFKKHIIKKIASIGLSLLTALPFTMGKFSAGPTEERKIQEAVNSTLTQLVNSLKEGQFDENWYKGKSEDVLVHVLDSEISPIFVSDRQGLHDEDIFCTSVLCLLLFNKDDAIRKSTLNLLSSLSSKSKYKLFVRHGDQFLVDDGPYRFIKRYSDLPISCKECEKVIPYEECEIVYPCSGIPISHKERKKLIHDRGLGNPLLCKECKKAISNFEELKREEKTFRKIVREMDDEDKILLLSDSYYVLYFFVVGDTAKFPRDCLADIGVCENFSLTETIRQINACCSTPRGKTILLSKMRNIVLANSIYCDYTSYEKESALNAFHIMNVFLGIIKEGGVAVGCLFYDKPISSDYPDKDVKPNEFGKKWNDCVDLGDSAIMAADDDIIKSVKDLEEEWKPKDGTVAECFKGLAAELTDLYEENGIWTIEFAS